MSYLFCVRTCTLFGTGKLNELHAQEMPGKKAMVVISNGKSMKKTGTLYRVLKELAAARFYLLQEDAAGIRNGVRTRRSFKQGMWLQFLSM